ncbi:hypothetical protein CDD83_7114 [Cordyceps sp. RAO-2017]|nr:hypothetical protein CDD83_7114 [Cordyceps sp. RAO-2017]
MAIQKSSGPPRRIRIKWPQLGATVTAELTSNASLVDLLFEKLPYRSLQNHALVSGDHLYHLVPSERLIYTRAEYTVADRTTEPDGTVFLSGLQHLAIKYGRLSEYLPAAPCGSVVPEDLAELRQVGNAVWKACSDTKQVIEVIVWDASQPEPTARLPLARERRGASAEVKELVEAIYEETDKSWSGISDDVRLVHQGLAPSGAGSKESYFATMVFLNGEIRPLGYNVLSNILKIAATQPQFSLRHLVSLYDVMVSVPSEFLGYTGASFLHMVFRRIGGLLNTIVLANGNLKEAREDFLAMVGAFARYVNLLNAQNLHLFPWKHTEEYRMISSS